LQKPVRKLRVAATEHGEWTAAASAELYGIKNWGAGYFDINDAGEVTVHVPADGAVATVSLMEIIRGMQQRKLTMPVLLRLDNLLEAQIAPAQQYVRQGDPDARLQSRVSRRLPDQGQPAMRGDRGDRASRGALRPLAWSAGSKAELLIALAYLEPDKGYIICNGYKDEEFIDLALQSLRLGFKVLLRDRDSDRAADHPGSEPAPRACGRCWASASSSPPRSKATGTNRAGIAASSA
jgi:arginine decarboxylase